MKRRVLIVGGGVSGLTAADVMNSLGTSVTIVERRPVLGGILCDLRRQVPGDNCRFCTVAESADGCLRVAAKKLGSIETLTETGITGVKKRRRGGFTVTLNNREGEEVDREFDSILLATGVSELCSEEELKEFGYGGGKDVLTALEFERMCIAVNDGRAKFVRSDGMPVRSVAFIGCVGSRNKSRRYCSATCCSYTLRQFNALKQAAEIENAKFFLMDLRLTDKRMWNYARNMLERGLDLVRCRLTKVERGEESVLLRYESDRDGIKTESFDLVVLMTAQVPDKEVQKKFSPLGVGFDENGFVVTKGGAATDVKGIFACGCATGPKSISESVIDSLSASADIAEYLSLKTEGTVVVFGGGVASLSSSIALSRLGLRVELVQNQSTKTRTLTDEEKKLWDRLARDVNRTGSITIHEEAKIESVRRGEKGWCILLREREGEQRLEVSAVVLAADGMAYNPLEGRLEDERITTLSNLKMKGEEESIAIILCDGAFSERYPFCGGDCCLRALKAVKKIKEENSRVKIFLLMKESANVGLDELLECKARESGAVFLRYPHGDSVRIGRSDEKIKLCYYDIVLREMREIEVERVAFTDFIVAGNYSEFVKFFNVELDEFGFIKEADLKFRPLRTAAGRVFGCGFCMRPQGVERAVSEAKACAVLAATVALKDGDEGRKSLSGISERLCTSCGLCVKECPFDARFLKPERKVFVDATLCVGCGLCVTICPSGSAFVLSES